MVPATYRPMYTNHKPPPEIKTPMYLIRTVYAIPKGVLIETEVPYTVTFSSGLPVVGPLMPSPRVS